MQNKPQKKLPTAREWIVGAKAAYASAEEILMPWCISLARMHEQNPKIFDEIVNLAPDVWNHGRLNCLRDVGAGLTHYRLAFDNCAAARAAMRHLPYAQQKLLCEKPIKVVRRVGDKSLVEQKQLNELSQHETQLLIDKEKRRVRSVDEQVTLLQSPIPSTIRAAERYRIEGDGDVLHVLPETKFTRSQIREILERMDQKALESLPQKK